MKEEIKSSVKRALSLTGEYELDEILEALLMNDNKTLDRMRSRCNQLRSAYNKFIEDVDGNDDDKKKIAISSFKRPA